MDDMLIMNKNKTEIDKLKRSLKLEFDMKDLGAAKRILGIDIVRERKKGTLALTQSLYIKKVLKAYGMLDSRMVSTPIPAHYKLKSKKGLLSQDELDYMNKIPYSNAVGCLMYAMVATRPDIAYGVGVVSRFMSCPSKFTGKQLSGY